MKIHVDECYELEGDYQNQFLGNEVFPKPKYKKLNVAERSVNKVHYNDVYILEPLHYYYVTIDKNLKELREDNKMHYLQTSMHYDYNGLIMSIDSYNNRVFLFNASQNVIYLQKGTIIGEVIL